MSKIIYKSNHNVIYSCKYHIVWCPKYRRKVLINGVDTRLKELIHEIAKELQLEIIEMEVILVYLRFGQTVIFVQPLEEHHYL